MRLQPLTPKSLAIGNYKRQSLGESMGNPQKLTTLALMSVLLTGCSSVKMYPICFYEKKPDTETLDRVIVPGLRKSFAAVLSGIADDLSVSPDARWIVASTTDTQDANLLKMWPRLACIGPAGSASEVKLQVDCISYVKDFIKERKYTELGSYKGPNGNTYYNESRDPNQLVYCSKRD